MIIKKNTLTGSYYIYPEYSLPQVSKTLPDFLKKRIEGMEPQEVNGFLIWHLDGKRKEKLFMNYQDTDCISETNMIHEEIEYYKSVINKYSLKKKGETKK